MPHPPTLYTYMPHPPSIRVCHTHPLYMYATPTLYTYMPHPLSIHICHTHPLSIVYATPTSAPILNPSHCHASSIVSPDRPVCTVSFSTDGLQVFGGSDDFTLSYWNLAEEKLTDTFSGHTDYIRCSSPLPSTNNIYCSGSFDHKLRLWDVRSRECTAVFDHGAPVECILPFPNGTAVITSGRFVLS